ncbi:DUF3108 domain-containing protein [Candidatus Sulfurimonas marisnigri]|uniref:DUF3108 domain-containing protein n=1 Tax=Candidatus Sulfurimonas marisnigri TaxID=2740405 RepID=A0A7S7M0T8_9BACT|nr:DUF3108 domain-containing protein [Candidatus Sulfurimonas marisnigri]QOY54997.1 DUF3108 domain-containing protein [Candidatus Sulfurimonas marisnigri]
MKILVMMFLFINFLYAQGFSTRYDVNVGMFGRVGYADLTLKENAESYELKLVAKTVDVAAFLLNNRVEIFISKGKIVNGKYIPDTFIKTKTKTRSNKVQSYYFNHEEKEITFVEEKTNLVSQTDFNPSTFEFTTRDVKESSKEEITLDDYIADDVLSSYLNTKSSCIDGQKSYNLFAIGAHNDENRVMLSCLDDTKKEATALLFSDGVKNIYNLHVEPMDKDETTVDVLVAYDNDGLLKEAVMDEVFWIGKITAKRVYHKISRK